VSGTLTGFNWYYLGSPISSAPRLTVGPYTIPGTYKYVAIYTNTCGTFYDTVTVTASATVPVKLVSFRAIPSGKNALIHWETASELNNSHFEIQHSTDGQTFINVGSVKGNGTTQNHSDYSYVDYSVGRLSTSIYYRLKQVDHNGYSDISKTALVKFGSENSSNNLISPNPYSDYTSVNLNTEQEGLITIEITDIQGRLISSQQTLVKTGISEIKVEGSEVLNKGIYFIKTIHLNTINVQRVVKQ
jgi:hypothetical protein